jgi:hypothetical protein
MKQNPNFPEGYCDVVTAQICLIDKVPNTKPISGTVEEMTHFWIKSGSTNIDFTASQFKSLIPHIKIINNFKVIYGSDSEFQKMGYVIKPIEEIHYQQLESAKESIKLGELNKIQD